MNLDRNIPGLPPTVHWVGEAQDGYLELIDQTLLPSRLQMNVIRTIPDLCEAIKTLRVRGAPAIGVAAAYGMVLAAQQAEADHRMAATWYLLEQSCQRLAATRPTAVNLFYALHRMMNAAHALFEGGHPSRQDWIERLLHEAQEIHATDLAACEAIGKHGAPLIKPDTIVLTHCNAGALATTGIGTATAPMYVAHREKISFFALCDETRPLLQGARLTAWELSQAGIDTTLICDNAAGTMMKEGRVHLVLVGADRIAANGDTANKIGTYGVAVLAKHHGIPFYIAAPTTTIDFKLDSGTKIPIEHRDISEVSHFGGHEVASNCQQIWNPAFDVTPAELIAGIITERGIFEPGKLASLKT